MRSIDKSHRQISSLSTGKKKREEKSLDKSQSTLARLASTFQKSKDAGLPSRRKSTEPGNVRSAPLKIDSGKKESSTATLRSEFLGTDRSEPSTQDRIRSEAEALFAGTSSSKPEETISSSTLSQDSSFSSSSSSSSSSFSSSSSSSSPSPSSSSSSSSPIGVRVPPRAFEERTGPKSRKPGAAERTRTQTGGKPSRAADPHAKKETYDWAKRTLKKSTPSTPEESSTLRNSKTPTSSSSHLTKRSDRSSHSSNRENEGEFRKIEGESSADLEYSQSLVATPVAHTVRIDIFGDQK